MTDKGCPRYLVDIHIFIVKHEPYAFHNRSPLHPKHLRLPCLSPKHNSVASSNLFVVFVIDNMVIIIMVLIIQHHGNAHWTRQPGSIACTLGTVTPRWQCNLKKFISHLLESIRLVDCRKLSIILGNSPHKLINHPIELYPIPEWIPSIKVPQWSWTSDWEISIA